MDMAEKLAALEVAQARLEERVSDMEDWKKKDERAFRAH